MRNLGALAALALGMAGGVRVEDGLDEAARGGLIEPQPRVLTAHDRERLRLAEIKRARKAQKLRRDQR